ncbi:DUF2793 domain-containing protein [Rhodobacteraceae bacterium]|nr:DUF2793 domain-containing protein [Paracoccaceae bacterium]
MTNTNRLGLPLVAPAQSQKHVTVNEGLVRLDALVHLSLNTVGTDTPPGAPIEGETHSVGAGATGLWAGEDGRIAIFVNGGWAFVTPTVGWQAWSVEAGARVAFDGANWVAGAGSFSPNGAGFVHRTIEVDHVVGSGTTSVVSGLLPAGSIVYGITARVLSGIGGAASLEIGVSGSSNRYGSGIGTGAGSYARGITGSPLAYYAATDVLLSAEGGSFDGTGVFRIAVHVAELTLPRG